ncbi:Two-component sensor histidine kinase, contains HisKA and HATPase domains [Sphingomonas sp. YR710]|nr:Two-component sensor histidine kinase, contains HisKA and HATPase domains [Sphingomonas sp. YR710]
MRHGFQKTAKKTSLTAGGAMPLEAAREGVAKIPNGQSRFLHEMALNTTLAGRQQFSFAFPAPWVNRSARYMRIFEAKAMPGQGWFQGYWRYVAAAGCVAMAFAIRVSLDPMFGHVSFVFSVFYLAVVLTAYFAGAGPAIFTSIASAAIAYWAFVSPPFAFKVDPEALTSMAFFMLTSAVDIYFITGMTRALHEYRIQKLRAEQLADDHAALFREYNERTTHHLQLVSALLQLRAGEGADAGWSDALTEASRRTMLIARAHRNMHAGSVSMIDLSVFAGQLLTADLSASGDPDLSIEISGDAIRVSPEQATSIAIILLEWFRFVLHRQTGDATRRIRLELKADSRGYCIALSSPSAVIGERQPADTLSRQIIQASADQLHGHARPVPAMEGLCFELVVPVLPETDPIIAAAIVPTTSTLH